MKPRTLKDLSRHEIKVIAEDYAYSSVTKTGEFFAERYDITLSTFYNLLKKAITESIVSETTAKAIANKAAENTERHGGSGARRRTLDMYNSLIASRKSFRLNRSEAKKWTKIYIESELFIEAFSRHYYIDSVLLKRALKDSVINGWITDEEVNLLKEKTKLSKDDNVEEAFAKMLEMRNAK